MHCYIVILNFMVAILGLTNATEPSPIPPGIQQLFDEVQLPCTPRAVLNHPCYFCKCNVHGNTQHCIFSCSPTSGRPLMPGSKMCTADDEFKQDCKYCRCSKGLLFYDCFLAKQCSNGNIPEEE